MTTYLRSPFSVLGRILDSALLRTENWGLRTFTLIASTLTLFVACSYAQQVDFAIGASSLWSSKNNNASQAFLPPAEKGGVYPNLSLQYHHDNRFGINVETAFRYHKGLYNGFQYYRPFFYDVNGVYSRQFIPKARADFMAGIGGETLLFYNNNACTLSAGNCATHVNSTHFLIHAGVGVPYYFRHRYFIRPEVNYYLILNNYQFHSDHVFRLGASIGRTFGH